MSTYRQPGTVLTDRTFAVPLDHRAAGGDQIEVFAREVVASDAAASDLPWLVFLQGGPGFGAERPVGRSVWLDRALRDYRVLLLDQRGTGRSSPANRRTLAGLGSARAQAGYLAHFRADAIVADAELIRGQVTGGAPWSVLGQSFGGFCAVTYLSMTPQGLREAFLIGGLPGLSSGPDDVYRLTYPAVAARSLAHYERYPADVERARQVARKLAAGPARLPGGTLFTVEAFQSLGLMLGSSTGSHALHYLLEDPFAGPELNDDFLYRAASILSVAGLTLDQALATLAARAAARASEIAAAYRGAEYAGRPDTEWRFEVIDIRIPAGPPDSGGETWVAYGTLRSQGADPWQTSYWDNHP